MESAVFIHTTTSPQEEGTEILMANRTPHIVGGGTKTQAKDEYLRKQAAAQRLAAARTPQVELAMSFVLRRKGFAALALAGMAEDDPQRVIFMDTLFTFKTAQPVKGSNGKTVKGAIRVAAEKNKKLFVDEATAEAALMASEWAQEALYWAGNKLHRSKPQPSAPAAKAPAINAPSPAQVFGNKVPAA